VIASIGDYFPRTYVINLPHRHDRRVAVTSELAKAGMPLSPGRVELFPAIRPDSAAGFPSIGVRGCYLSHLAVLRRALAEGLPRVLIVEDDVTLSPRFAAESATLIGRLSAEDWGIVHFGHRLPDLESVPPHAPLGFVARPPGEIIVTAHCYGVNGPVIPRLVEFLEAAMHRPGGHPDCGPMHVDGAISGFRDRNRDVLTLAASPSLAGQRPSRSDIAANRWFDRLPVFRELASLARRGKELLGR
jgi:hypothetical protein